MLTHALLRISAILHEKGQDIDWARIAAAIADEAMADTRKAKQL